MALTDIDIEKIKHDSMQRTEELRKLQNQMNKLLETETIDTVNKISKLEEQLNEQCYKKKKE